MLPEDFYNIFQQKYAIINEYEKTRYKLEYDLYILKPGSKPILSPLITFTQKTLVFSVILCFELSNRCEKFI